GRDTSTNELTNDDLRLTILPADDQFNRQSAIINPIVTRQSAIANRLFLLGDGHLELRGDVAMQLDLDRRRAERLERFGQLDLPTIDVQAVRRQRVRQVRRRDRAVQLFGLSDAPRDVDLELADTRRHRLRRRALLGLAGLGKLALPLDQLAVAVVARQRPLPRQQGVARVARRHLDHLATP